MCVSFIYDISTAKPVATMESGASRGSDTYTYIQISNITRRTTIPQYMFLQCMER